MICKYCSYKLTRTDIDVDRSTNEGWEYHTCANCRSGVSTSNRRGNLEYVWDVTAPRQQLDRLKDATGGK